jgi:Calpain family cysteine protease
MNMATSEIARQALASDAAVRAIAAAANGSAGTIGAANPKAIAELRLGRTLDPQAADFQQTLAETLGKPYEQLFDPKFGSPVFVGISHVLAASVGEAALAAPSGVEAKAVEALPAVAAVAARVSPVILQEISVVGPVWWPILLTDLTYAVPGAFIVDAPTATAPVQGALADCWLISAMASVAWCHADSISERTLKDGSGVVQAGGADYEFTFYASANWSVGKAVSVKDDVPQSSGQYVYARSSVAGETWPANLEKAFIGMRGATGFVEPSSTNYAELNYGDAAWAVASLVGRPPWYHNANAADAWSAISARCTNGRATQPMTAWTYGTGSATVSYDGSGIVANHAYSILGTETSGGHNYVVLRNPWAFHEGSLNALAGTWQGLTLPGEGAFALRMDTFAQYYAGFGGA